VLLLLSAQVSTSHALRRSRRRTATVCSIIAKLRKEQAEGTLPTFEFISLNGMEMRNPYEAYIKFWEAVSGNRDKKGYEVAVGLLDRFFAGKLHKVDSCTNDSNKSSKPVIVLMLDEIDYLVTAKQTVIYNFFDWPMRASLSQNGGPRLVVIGISNRLNLASLLKPSVQSRLGHFRCSFKSYNAQGLVEILTNKIQPDPTGYRVFDKDAILFCARKIAAHSGDLRKALKTCQAAALEVMKEVQDGVRNDAKSPPDQPMVRIQDVQKVTQEAFHSIATQAISASRAFPALLLICLGALCKSTGQETGGFDIKQLMTKMKAVASASGNNMYMPPPSFHATLKILAVLAQTHLIRLETPKSSSTSFRAAQGGSGGAFPLILAEFDHSILVRAFKDTPHKELAEKHLGGVH
jgi:origin recognition complex subunit 1